MVEFKNGVFTAPALEVAPCGLLSVVTPNSPVDSRWLRGFSTESISNPDISLLDRDSHTVEEGVVSERGDAPNSYDTSPFFFEVKVKTTGFDVAHRSPLDDSSDLVKQAEGAAQKVLETELWSGTVARAAGDADPDEPSPNLYLSKEGGAEVISSTGVSPERALALIEGSIASSPTGSRGIIHMSRDVASSLGSRLIYKIKSREDENSFAVTRLGTFVVIGSGYSGSGPVGQANAAPSLTNKWIYATGNVSVYLGVSEAVNEDISQGFKPETNDSFVSILRPAAIHFDPSIWSTVRVTLG